MKIVTWNFRCVWANVDGKNSVINRAGFAYDKILKERPEMIAFQEIAPITFELLKKILPEYEFFGSQRTADYSEEGLYIAFRKDLFALMGGEIFWLSPTPYVAGSRFENQSWCSRVCVMAKLRDLKTNECYRFWNVHLDHISDEARRQGVECLFEMIKHFSVMDTTPHVVLGDFNATPDSETMKWCDSQIGFTDVSKGFQTTYHGFGTITDAKIDYVYLSDSIQEKVEKTEIWTDEHDGV
ncbi:MAG: hypothetical protein IIX01_01055, partial [Clostridia bacterium]|nr:hypothetical protein [Clostridia bacterium]